jgi:hypothetical protein
MYSEKVYKNSYVIHDVFDDPNTVKQYITDYCKNNNPVEQQYAAGKRWVDNQPAFSISDILKHVKQLNEGRPLTNDAMQYQFVSEQDGMYNWIHKDHFWTGIIYLQEDVPEDCGTALYSLDNSVVIEKEYQKLYINNNPLLHFYPDHPAWNLVYESKYIFNTMFFFRGDKHFHMGSEGYGTDLDNSRLTIPLFFR